MRATEVLRRYAAGERNFQRVNLRGQSFKGQDLSEANFSEADIRGTNFKNANLQEVNFTEAKAGLQKRWVAFLLFTSLFLSGISGFCSLFLGYLISLLFDDSNESFYAGLLFLTILVTFLINTFRKGIIAGANAGAITGAVALTINVAVAFAFPGAISIAGIFAIIIAGAVTGTVAVSVAGAIAFAVAGAVAFAIAIVGAVTFAIIFAVVFGGALAVTVTESVIRDVAIILFSFFFAFTFTLFGLFIGWRALKGDERDAWVRSFAVTFAATGGTNFQGANLTDAIFTRATLKNTDFKEAILTRTCFRNAKKLDLARPGNTYLKISKLQQWLTGTGQDKNFDKLDLRGVNFQEKILTDASFIGADLSEANLQDADLSRAKLVQTPLDGTDFTGSTLTGAFIEDWGITSSTVLNKVRCEYVFMRLPPEKRPQWLPLPIEESLDPNPCRKPDNWNENFQDNDFADFIKPIFDTLDLYHNQDVDPRAIAISWKQLAENNPDANLRFASMEVKGEDNLLLRLKTAPNIDLSSLNAEYFETYNQIKALAEADYKKLITEKDNRIQQLENMVNTALKRPSFYAENYSHQGDFIMSGDLNIRGNYIEGNKTDQSRNLNISGGTINATGAGAFSLGDINGTVANTINQLPSSSDANETGIKELLTQLQQAIDDPNLSEDDQKQTLEQIQTLAEAGQNPKDETMQKKAKKAVGFLKVIAEGIEPATQLAQACGKVLPKILLFFGL